MRDVHYPSVNTLQSAPARLHVKGAAPELNRFVPGDLPLSLSVNPGGSTEIRAHATDAEGCSPPHFQWRRDQLPIPGKSGACQPDGANGWLALLTLDNAQREDAGLYSVVFWNEYGALLSSVQHADTALTVNTTWPVEIVPHEQIVYNRSEDVTLTVTTSFTATCIQWYKDGVLLPDANDSTYVIEAPIDCEDQGVYSVIVYDLSHLPHQSSPDQGGVSVDGCF